MHTIEIPHIKTTLEIPEYLGEFTVSQYKAFCELWVKVMQGVLDYGTFRIHLIYGLLGMERSKLAITTEQEETRNENIYRLSELVDDYFESTEKDGKTVKSVHLSFVDNKIPFFTHKGVDYYGPKDVLTNITFGEYRNAINFYRDYAKTQSDEALNLLVATLYREPKPATQQNANENFQGDRRVPYITAAVEPRAEKLKNLPEHIKYGVFLFFQSCQNYITTTQNVEIEGNDVNLAILFKPDANNTKGIGFAGLRFSLAETKVFGTAEETDKELLWNILLRLYQNHLEAERLKQKHNATTNKA